MFPNKICQICDGKATGFNYSTLSCESCKVFFHRNWKNIKKLKCKTNGKCSIDTKTRRKCAACRLNKCIKSGMTRKCPYICKYSKRKTKTSTQEYEDKHEKAILQNKITNIEHDTEYDLLCSLFTNKKEGTKEQRQDHVKLNKRKFVDLTEYERKQIGNVRLAGSVYIDESTLPVTREATKIEECLEVSELYFRQIIQFSRHFTTFTYLSKSDQFALIKPAFYDIMTIRMSFLFDHKTNGFYFISNEKGTELIFCSMKLIEQIRNPCFKTEIFKFLLDINEELESDSTIVNLLSVQTIFNPKRANISHVENVHYANVLYRRLLLRYLEHKYRNVHQAQLKYHRLMRLMEKLNSIKEIERRLYIEEFDVDQFPHIIIELFNFC